MSTICLIRHGKTEANERHLYCGSTDIALSAAGEQELADLRTSYAGIRAARFVTSGMRRTEQTLQLLFGEWAHEIEPRLREMDFGTFEMHCYEELKEDAAYQDWITGDNEANLTPGGESGNIMRERVLAAFDELCRDGRDTVVITHGGVIAAIMAYLFPEEGRNRYQWQPRPGHGWIIKEHTFQPL